MIHVSACSVGSESKYKHYWNLLWLRLHHTLSLGHELWAVTLSEVEESSLVVQLDNSSTRNILPVIVRLTPFVYVFSSLH